MTPTTAPTTPQASDGPRRLVRTPDKKIAGVCSGIAHYLGIDPTIVRIVFLLSALLGGIGLLAYIVGWIVMPKGEASTPAQGDAADGWTVAAVVAVAVGAAALFGWPGFVHGGEAVFGLLLIAGGVALLLRRADGSGPPSPAVAPSPETPPDPSAPPDPPPAGDPPADLAEGDGLDESRAGVTDAPPASDTAPPDSGRRGVVTAGTLSLLAIGTAGLVAAALADWVELSTATVLAAALVIVGAGLVLASVVGPAPWLFVVATLLTLSLLVAAAVEPWVEDGLGERTYAPAAVSDLQDRYELGIGDLEVDLSAVDIGSGTHAVEVSLGIGNVLVTVPPGVDVELRGHVDAGELVAPGDRSENGVDESLNTRIEGVGDGLLVIDLDVGFGRGEVRRGL